MIYKAFLNRQEITGFPVKGKDITEIYGGDTLLWKKGEQGRELGVTFFLGYPTSAFNTASGLKTSFMDERVFHYNTYLDVICTPYINSSVWGGYSWAYYYKYRDEGFIEFQFLLRAKSVSKLEFYTYVSNDTRKYPDETSKQVVLQTYKLGQAEDEIYTINGTYEPIFLDAKDVNGQYLVKGFGTKSFATGGGGIEGFKDINEAINFLKNSFS